MLDPWVFASGILASALVLHYVHAAGRERMLGKQISEYEQRLIKSNGALALAIARDRRQSAEASPPGQGEML